VDFLGQRVDLAATVARGNHEIVVQRGDPSHVEDGDVTGLVVECDASTEGGTLLWRRQLGRGWATDGCGAQWTSFAQGAGEPEARATIRNRNFSVVVDLPAAANIRAAETCRRRPSTDARPARSLPTGMIDANRAVVKRGLAFLPRAASPVLL